MVEIVVVLAADSDNEDVCVCPLLAVLNCVSLTLFTWMQIQTCQTYLILNIQFSTSIEFYNRSIEMYDISYISMISFHIIHVYQWCSIQIELSSNKSFNQRLPRLVTLIWELSRH